MKSIKAECVFADAGYTTDRRENLRQTGRAK